MRIITAVVMGSLLVGSSAMADELKAVRTITVSGQAERKVVPDEAHMTVNLNAMEPKLADAKAAHDAKLEKLMALVKKFGVDEKKVRTQSSNVQPVYSYVNDPKTNANVRRFDGYRVQTSLDITVVDTTKLGQLMDATSNAGFEQGGNPEWGDLMNVYYTLSDSDKIRSDLLQQAIANAKIKASSMAQAAGSSLGAVWQITEGGVQFQQPVPMMMSAVPAMAMSAKESVAPPAGEQQVTASVTISYELKN